MKIKERLLKLFLLNYLYFVVANLHLAYEFPINHLNSFGAGIKFFVNYKIIFVDLFQHADINPMEYVKGLLGPILTIIILINVFSLLKDLYSKKFKFYAIF